MVGQVLPVAFDIRVTRFEYHVAAFTVVDRVEDRLVAFVYPSLSQSANNRL